MLPSNWILEPGALVSKPRLAPNGEGELKYAGWVRRELPSTRAVLEKAGYPLTAWTLAAALLARLLTEKGRNDRTVREQWFEFLFPLVESEMAQ